MTQLISPNPSSWLGHLQSLIRHHFTSQVLPEEIQTSGGEFQIPLLSGFEATVQVTSAGNNVTINHQSNVVPFRSQLALRAVNDG
jgi:hypothetical protein